MIWIPSPRGGTFGALLDGANRSNREKESMMKVTTIGIDLAKTTLSVQGADDNGKVERGLCFWVTRPGACPRTIPSPSLRSC